MLERWWARINLNQQAHYLAGLRFARMNLALGVPTVILTAGIGTSAFVSLIEAQPPTWRVVAGLLSILATVLASLQTFLSLPQRVANHRNTSAEFGSIRRALEELQTKLEAHSLDVTLADEEVGKIKERIDKAEAGSPDVPKSVWERAYDEVKIGKSFMEQESPAGEGLSKQAPS
jgi:hypothetical protein